MKKLRGILLLTVCVLLLTGGATVYIGASERRVVYAWLVSDAALTAGHDSCIAVATVDDGAANALHNCFVPANRTLVIESFSVVATGDATESPLLTSADGEECLLVLETQSTGATGTGTDVVSSKIWVGQGNPNAAGNCDTGAVTIDDRGEGCTRTIDTSDANATVQGGGWFRVTLQDDATNNATCGGGDCTCDTMQAVVLYVIGRLE